MALDVIILAGARNQGPLKEISTSDHEALIKIADIPMVEYVIKAVNEAKHTRNIIVVGPRDELKESIQEKVDLFIESGESLTENIFRGITRAEKNDYILLMTSDIPLITADVIDDYIVTCLKDGKADLYYPIIPKEYNLTKFPKVKRTYFHLAEGVFTGGNMVLIKPRVLEESNDILEKALSLRKKPWKLSRLLGMKFIFKFVIGQLSIGEIESKVASITGCRGHFMITNHPEIGFDVDKPSDLRIMQDKVSS
ncbi:MAG: NTP transferase domain-containing protein [Halanaerobiales bacterium]